MIDVEQFRRIVVAPTLMACALWSEAAERLLVGTYLHEGVIAGTTYLEQKGGRAVSVFQIEPATATDIRRYLIERQPAIAVRITNWVGMSGRNSIFQMPDDFLNRRLKSDLELSCAFCRVKYYMRPERLPDAEDIDALAEYWKKHYNSPAGKGTAAQWALAYRTAHKAFRDHNMQGPNT